MNCGSIAPTLLESELFGYEKGAFTGAQSRRSGYFECANGGTLFLDEIGELPLTAQVQLLRVLDRKIIQRVGDPRAIPVDVRVVAATNRDLEEMVEKGTFRRDLYYRLSVYPLSIPPLRERKVDILPLVRHFIAAKTQEMGTTMPPEPGQAELDRQCQGAGTRSGAGAYRQPFRVGDAPPCFWRKAETAQTNVAL